MYFKDVCGQLKYEIESGKREQGKPQLHFMQQHGARFDNLSDTIKGQYASKAAIARATSANDVADELSLAECELALHREQKTWGKAIDRPRFLLSECRFSPKDVSDFEQCLHRQCSRTNVSQSCASATPWLPQHLRQA